MKNLSVTQSYMLCALNEKGKFPAMASETNACMLAGGLIDLLLEKCIKVSDKKISITAPLGTTLYCLQSLYNFIEEKGEIKLDKLASEYCFSFSGKKINSLIDAAGNALNEQGCVTLKKGGLLNNKNMFVPNKDEVDGIVQHIRAEFLEEGCLSDEIVALTSLLEKSGMLKHYFSKYEKDSLKARLKEIRTSSSNKIVRELLEYVDAILVIVIVAAT